ncbi:NUDIX domain-containing protein [Amphritea sp. HPY]|uniref:NUDIX domain-containing protein n=1 Tax=Amphritea sp. HPY TaxID=3421652 RepID=UPI003D7F0EAF
MTDWKPRFGAQHMEVVEQERVFDGFFKINRMKIRHALFQGGDIEIVREQFQRDDAVCVLLFDPVKDVVVLIEQFRVGAIAKGRDTVGSPWLLELVAGIVEPGETAEDVARRESVEEAGAQISDIVPINRYLPSAGGSDEYIDLLCARVDSSGLGGVHGLPEEGEDILVHLIPLAKAFALVASGKIDNAATIIALQWLQLNKTELLSRWRVL